MSVLKIPIEP